MEAYYRVSRRFVEAEQTMSTPLPRTILQQLESIARQGIEPDLLLQHYKTVLVREFLQPESHEALAPSCSERGCTLTAAVDIAEGPYGCPWCASMIKLEKDFIRHVKEKCCLETEFRCPDCSKCYTRKHRLANHHKKHHPNRCGPGACSHIHSASVRRSNTETLGCGFCPALFSSDLHGYLRHLINHYRQGARRVNWQNGPHVPMVADLARPLSPPPQVTLGKPLEMGFPALRSGFGLEHEESPCRSDSTISTSSTLFRSMDTPISIDVKGQDDLYPLQASATIPPYHSHTFHASTHRLPFEQALHSKLPGEDFNSNIDFLDEYPDSVNPDFVDPTNDIIIAPSVAAIKASSQLFEDMRLDNTFSTVAFDPILPPFNPTPPLHDMGLEYSQRSLSERLLRKFQSLSPLCADS